MHVRTTLTSCKHAHESEGVGRVFLRDSSRVCVCAVYIITRTVRTKKQVRVWGEGERRGEEGREKDEDKTRYSTRGRGSFKRDDMYTTRPIARTLLAPFIHRLVSKKLSVTCTHVHASFIFTIPY